MNRNWSSDIQALGDRIAVLSLARAAELGEYLETVYGVKAADTPVLVPTDKLDPKDPVPPPVPPEFNVVLEGFDPYKKIGVIKTMREMNTLGLKEARDFVESCPHIVGERLPRAEAEKLKGQLTAAGGIVSLKQVA